MKVELLSSRSRIQIDRLPASIGRSAQASVQLPDPEVSRKHCLLEQREGELVIRDAGSTNGTFVNGLRVGEAVLVSGDRVSLGQTRFCVLYQREASCSSRSPDSIHGTPCAERLPDRAGPAGQRNADDSMLFLEDVLCFLPASGCADQTPRGDELRAG
jgi:predicted component of type VI protein secretion system